MRKRRARQSSGDAGLNFQQMAARVGLTPALTLDAGWPASYASGQTWADISGNSRDFFLGLDGSATATDPTLNAGGVLTRGRYFLYDGGDCNLKASANDAFFNGLHKDNATSTFVFLIYYPTITASTRLLCTARIAGDVGVRYLVDASAKLTVSFNNAGGFQTLKTATAAVTGNKWSFLAISHSEGGGATGSFIQIDGTVETYDGAITSPSASDASKTASLFAHENASSPVENGTRVMGVLGFASALSQAQVAALRAQMMARVA